MSGAVKTTCPYCGVGCGLVATHAEDGTVAIAGDPDHPANYGRLCSKGSALGETIDLEGRLLRPEIGGKRVSWDEALDTVAGTFNNIISNDGPDAVAFYVSGQLLTEDYYVANKLMKGFIGSANIDTNSRLCMSSSVAGHKRAFGSDTVPGCYEDLELADVVVFVGSNAAWCHPVLYQRIIAAKKSRPEMTLVVIDPRRTPTAETADLHLPLRSGTDAILFNGLLVYLFERGLVDRKGVSSTVDGLDDALAAARNSSWDAESVARDCHLDIDDVAAFFELVAGHEKTVTLYSQGIHQSSSGSDKVNAILNCHLATGRIGRPGMGPFSLTGQPNAMGGREVGGLANQLAAHMELESAHHRDIVGRFWGSKKVPAKAGLTAVDLFDAVGRGEIKAVWIMGTNPAVSLPDAAHVRAALEKCKFVVVSDVLRDTDTARYADVLLPALAWGEKEGTVTNSERRISRQRAFLPAPGEARADWRIICDVANRMGFGDAFAYDSPAAIFREHAALSGVANNGTRDFDIGDLQGISNIAYDTLAPIQWPVRKKNVKGTTRLFSDGAYFTPSGKARMLPIIPRQPVNAPDRTFPFILNTGRVRDHWHTMTRTGKSPRLSSHSVEPYVEMHPADAAALEIGDGQLVCIESAWGSATLKARLSDGQTPGTVFMPIHWTDQVSSQCVAGILVNPETDPVSYQPELKHTPIRVRAVETKWQAFILARDPLTPTGSAYWARARRNGCWLYEVSGTDDIPDVEAWATALSPTGVGGGDVIAFADGRTGSHRIAVLENGRLVFCLFMASGRALPARDWLVSQFTAERLSDDARTDILAGVPRSGSADCGATVCSCFGVGLKTLQEAIASDHLTSVQQIGEVLQAGTNCGSCIPELEQLLGSADDRRAGAARVASAA